MQQRTHAVADGNMWNRKTYKGFANNLTLLLGFSDALQTGEKKFASIDYGEIDPKMLLERCLHLLALIEAHQS